jgi:hypothetical protein
VGAPGVTAADGAVAAGGTPFAAGSG